MGKIRYRFGEPEEHTLEAKWSMLTDFLQIFLDGEEKTHMTFSFSLPRSANLSVIYGNEEHKIELRMTPDLMRIQRFELFIDGRAQTPENFQ